VNSVEFLLLFQLEIGAGLACLAFAATVYALLLRRSVMSAFDPLFLGAIAHVFAAAVMAFLVVEEAIDTYFVMSFLLTEVAFWLGFFAIAKPVRPSQFSAQALTDRGLFARFYVVCVLCLLGAVAAFVGRAGLLITQDVSRLVVMQEMGWVSWLYDGSTMLVPVLVLLKRYVLEERSRADWVVLTIVLFALTTKGGKSDFVLAAFAVFLVGSAFSVRGLLNAAKVLYVAVPILLFAVTILVLSAWGSEMTAADLLAGRFVLFGDVFFQGYDATVFAGLPDTNWFQYFFGSLANAWSQVTGALAPPRVVLGYELSKYYYGVDEGMGPNARHNILGLYLFGFWGSLPFSFACGLAVSFVRARPLLGTTSAVGVALYLAANIAIVFVMIDPTLGVAYMIKLAIVGLLAYAAARVWILRDSRGSVGGGTSC
jgi:hypothetical protein